MFSNINKMKNIYVILLISIIILLSLIVFIYNLKRESFLNNSKTTIPKIIIQTWKSNQIPLEYKKEVDSVKNKNKNFRILFFTDEDIENFLREKYPQYYKTYKKLPIKIQKIDFFRYVAVYHYGGFYYDLDMRALKPLDRLVNYKVVFPLEQNSKRRCLNPRFYYLCNQNCYHVIGNYAFGAIPKSDFLKILIDNIHNNIDNIIETYKKAINLTYFVYQTTGPDYISLIYYNYANKKNVKILDTSSLYKKHYFGEYAVHTLAGTWKRQ